LDAIVEIGDFGPTKMTLWTTYFLCP